MHPILHATYATLRRASSVIIATIPGRLAVGKILEHPGVRVSLLSRVSRSVLRAPSSNNPHHRAGFVLDSERK